ncbi:MAG TPA: ROK family protein [Phototrophicaceae bacterium]|nr:ROK family protein [Phototrophicaceae bacterium]
MELNPTSQTQTDIRRLNRHAVLNLFHQHGTLSKSELVRLTELTVTTIATILEELIDEDLVEVADTDANPSGEATRGRPASLYRLSKRRWIVAGIQIASNSVTGVLLDFSGQVLDSASVAAPSDLAADNVLEIASDLLQFLMQRSTTPDKQLLGIGVALEGFVDVAAGVSLWMLFRSRWRDVPVAAYFGERFAVPVLVDYRVYAAALAEAVFGAARGVSDFAYLNVDTGVAVAYVASGQMVRSSVGAAGVTGGLGHVLTTNGTRLCYCGKVGCLHTEITTQALLTQLKELVIVSQGSGIGEFWQTHELRFDNLVTGVQQGDALALQLRSRFAQSLAIAVSSTAQLFSANMIVIGGVAVQFGGKEALDTAHAAVQQLTILHSQFGLTKIVASNLSPDPATMGAATLVIQAVMDGQIRALAG